MKRKVLAVVLALIPLFLMARAATARTVDSRPLERHIRGLQAQVSKVAPQSFTHKYPDGKLREQFTITPGGYAYASFDHSGVKMVEWSRTNDRIAYESWYAPGQTKERLLEDGRTISYTSFRKNGQKWEQYDFNKDKKVKSYAVYDKDGHLVQP